MSGFWYVGFPYLAVAFAVIGGIVRFYGRRFSYSSLSSQLLESRRLFWGSVPWHYGITAILLAHLLAGLFPKAAAATLGRRLPMLILEVTGMSLALLALVGLVVLVVRRLPGGSHPRAVTSLMDGVLLSVLLVQVATGLGIALFERWGGRWYVHTAAPWFWSLLLLRPDPSTVAFLPPFVRFHFVLGFGVILLFPVTRLVHLVKLPVWYLWRPYQVVVWNRRPGERPGGEAHGHGR